MLIGLKYKTVIKNYIDNLQKKLCQSLQGRNMQVTL